MSWWFKARQAHTCLPVAVFALLVLVTVVQDLHVVLPSFSLTGENKLPLMLFVPIPLLAGLMVCLESRLMEAELTGTRRIAVLDLALSVGTVAVAQAVGSSVGHWYGTVHPEQLGRNTAFLVGLMLCGRALWGQPAAMLPVLWAAAVTMVGFRSPRDPYPWTVIPEASGTWYATTGAALLFLVGLAAQFFTARRVS
ncbi:hypothetical protein [Streptomyces sp. TE5632]